MTKTKARLCKHCRYSVGSQWGLWCHYWQRITRASCEHWEREPGVDDE